MWRAARALLLAIFIWPTMADSDSDSFFRIANGTTCDEASPCTACVNPKNDGACISNPAFGGKCTNPNGSVWCGNGDEQNTQVTSCQEYALVRDKENCGYAAHHLRLQGSVVEAYTDAQDGGCYLNRQTGTLTLYYGTSDTNRPNITARVSIDLSSNSKICRRLPKVISGPCHVTADMCVSSPDYYGEVNKDVYYQHYFLKPTGLYVDGTTAQVAEFLFAETFQGVGYSVTPTNCASEPGGVTLENKSAAMACDGNDTTSWADSSFRGIYFTFSRAMHIDNISYVTASDPDTRHRDITGFNFYGSNDATLNFETPSKNTWVKIKSGRFNPPSNRGVLLDWVELEYEQAHKCTFSLPGWINKPTSVFQIGAEIPEVAGTNSILHPDPTSDHLRVNGLNYVQLDEYRGDWFEAIPCDHAMTKGLLNYYIRYENPGDRNLEDEWTNKAIPCQVDTVGPWGIQAEGPISWSANGMKEPNSKPWKLCASFAPAAERSYEGQEGIWETVYEFETADPDAYLPKWWFKPERGEAWIDADLKFVYGALKKDAYPFAIPGAYKDWGYYIHKQGTLAITRGGTYTFRFGQFWGFARLWIDDQVVAYVEWYQSDSYPWASPTAQSGRSYEPYRLPDQPGNFWGHQQDYVAYFRDGKDPKSLLNGRFLTDKVHLELSAGHHSFILEILPLSSSKSATHPPDFSLEWSGPDSVDLTALEYSVGDEIISLSENADWLPRPVEQGDRGTIISIVPWRRGGHYYVEFYYPDTGETTHGWMETSEMRPVEADWIHHHLKSCYNDKLSSEKYVSLGAAKERCRQLPSCWGVHDTGCNSGSKHDKFQVYLCDASRITSVANLSNSTMDDNSCVLEKADEATTTTTTLGVLAKENIDLRWKLYASDQYCTNYPAGYNYWNGPDAETCGVMADSVDALSECGNFIFYQQSSQRCFCLKKRNPGCTLDRFPGVTVISKALFRCVLTDDGCITSPNFQESGDYVNSDSCDMIWNGYVSSVDSFITEAQYDNLQFGDHVFSGFNGPPLGLPMFGRVVWKTNADTVNRGWKICLQDTPPPTGIAQVSPGYPCKLEAQGNCATSPNYPMTYKPSQSCEFPFDGHIASVEIHTGDSADNLVLQHLYDQGTAYSSGNRPSLNMRIQGSVLWSTNSLVEASGFRICKDLEVAQTLSVNHFEMGQHCPSQQLNAQDDVDLIKSTGCTQVDGWLWIRPSASITAPLDLRPLAGVSTIRGGLHVDCRDKPDGVTSLAGLENIVSSDYDRQFDWYLSLSLRGCTKLASLKELRRFGEGNERNCGDYYCKSQPFWFQGAFLIDGLVMLPSLEGLENVKAIGASERDEKSCASRCKDPYQADAYKDRQYGLMIKNCDSLKNLSGLGSLKWLSNAPFHAPGGSAGAVDERDADEFEREMTGIELYNNVGLTSLAGTGITRAWSLSIEKCHNLRSLAGLNIEGVMGGVLNLDDNEQLEDVVALQDLWSFVRGIRLNNLPSMRSLSGFAGLSGLQNTFTSALTIHSLPLLRSLHGLEFVTGFSSITITDCPSLTSTSALYQLESPLKAEPAIGGAPGACLALPNQVVDPLFMDSADNTCHACSGCSQNHVGCDYNTGDCICPLGRTGWNCDTLAEFVVSVPPGQAIVCQEPESSETPRLCAFNVTLVRATTTTTTLAINATNTILNALCVDTDNGAADVAGDPCLLYVKEWCGEYDDGDFTSNDMCCLCGGGQAIVYGRFSSGTCASNNGMETISDISSCEAAAQELALADTTIRASYKNDRPTGCTYASNGVLELNSASTLHDCGTADVMGTYDCVCVKVTCLWRETNGCSPNGTREPQSDKNCYQPIPPAHSGYCDCDGDGQMNNGEQWFNCTTTPGNCDLVCHPPTKACGNTDNGIKDALGYGCWRYSINPSSCAHHDNNDFTASEMCCACGGGQAQGCSNTDNGAVDPDNYGCASYSLEPSRCGQNDGNGFLSNEMCCACGGGKLAQERCYAPAVTGKYCNNRADLPNGGSDMSYALCRNLCDRLASCYGFDYYPSYLNGYCQPFSNTVCTPLLASTGVFSDSIHQMVVPCEATVPCPQLYPHCDSHGDCIISSCLSGCESWTEAPSASTPPNGTYNSLSGNGNGTTCTSDYQAPTTTTEAPTTTTAEATVSCPELYPICELPSMGGYGDCIISSCVSGCNSWTEAPSASTPPNGTYNYIYGDGNGVACTSDYQAPTTTTPAPCMWRQTGGCTPDGTRDPQSDVFCDATIPRDHSGYCDCNGDGQMNSGEPGYNCVTTPMTCDLVCNPQADSCAACVNPKNDGVCISNSAYEGKCTNPGSSAWCHDGQNSQLTSCKATRSCPQLYPICELPSMGGYGDCIIESCITSGCNSWAEAPSASTPPNGTYNYVYGDGGGAPCTSDYQATITTTTTTTEAPCMWRQTGGCTPDGTRDPQSDVSCDATIPRDHSGYCDCNGDGQRNSGEAGYNCVTTPMTCDLVCNPQADSCAACVNPKNDGACISNSAYEGKCTNPGASAWCHDGQNSQLTSCQATRSCPQLYPICELPSMGGYGDCIIESCMTSGCNSWSEAPSASTPPNGTYNYIYGDGGGAPCTTDYQALATRRLSIANGMNSTANATNTTRTTTLPPYKPAQRLKVYVSPAEGCSGQMSNEVVWENETHGVLMATVPVCRNANPEVKFSVDAYVGYKTGNPDCILQGTLDLKATPMFLPRILPWCVDAGTCSETSPVPFRVTLERRIGQLVFRSATEQAIEESFTVLYVLRVGGSSGFLRADVGPDFTASTVTEYNKDTKQGDVSATMQALEWQDGDDSAKPYFIEIKDDAEAEDNEMLKIKILSVNYEPARGTELQECDVSIVDNGDGGKLMFVNGTVTVEESSHTLPACAVQVQRIQGSSGQTSVDVVREPNLLKCSSNADPATLFDDFVMQKSSESRLVWEDGEDGAKCLRTQIEIFGDGDLERDEVICLRLDVASLTGSAAVSAQSSYMLITLADKGIEGGISWSCVKGSPCSLDLNLPRVDSGDRILIAPRCGSDFPLSGATFEERETMLEMQDSQMFTANFGQGLKDASPGEYAVCRCSVVNSSCGSSSLDQYVKRLGTLTLDGPDIGQEFTCNRGQPCDIRGVRGLNLASPDRVSVFHACGTTNVQGLPGADLGGAGIAEIDASSTSDFRFLNQDLQASSDILRTIAGIYKMCFCRSGATLCNQDSFGGFLGSVGLFYIYGPTNTDHTYECVVGSECIIASSMMQGLELNQGDSMMAMHACPSESAWDDTSSMQNTGFPSLSVRGEASANGNGYAYSFGMLSPDNVMIGFLKLCWCPESASCTQPSHHGALLGQLRISCPPGYYSIIRKCTLCPKGFYCSGGVGGTDSAAAGGSKVKCEQGSTTLTTGATSSDDCLCDRGYFLNSVGDCELCPKASYKSSIGAAGSCQGCPPNTTTRLGAKTESQCIPEVTGTSSGQAGQDATQVPAITGSFKVRLKSSANAADFELALKQRICSILGLQATPTSDGGESCADVEVRVEALQEQRRLQDSSNVKAGYTWRSWSATENQDAASQLTVELQDDLPTHLPAIETIEELEPAKVISTVLNCTEGKSFFPGSQPTSIENCECSSGWTPSLQSPSVCARCEKGKFKQTVGQGLCEACGVDINAIATLTTRRMGALSPVECVCPSNYYGAATSCSRCEPGYYCKEGSNIEQLPCPNGSFQREYLTDACDLCSEGRYSEADPNGTKSCDQCVRGKFQESEGQSQCEFCGGKGFTTDGSGSDKELDCGCAAPKFVRCAQGLDLRECDTETLKSKLDEGLSYQCEKCPEGFDCKGFFSKADGSHAVVYQVNQKLYHSQPRAKKDYYVNSDNPYDSFLCKPDSCVGGKPGQTCRKYREGLVCNRCESGRFKSKWDDNCHDCGTRGQMGALWLIPLAILTFVFVYNILKRDHHTQTDQMVFIAVVGGVIVRVMQILTILDIMQLRGVEPFKGLISFAGSIFVVDIQIFQVGCAVGNSATASFGIQLLMVPFVILVVVGELVLIRSGLCRGPERIYRQCKRRVQRCVRQACKRLRNVSRISREDSVHLSVQGSKTLTTETSVDLSKSDSKEKVSGEKSMMNFGAFQSHSARRMTLLGQSTHVLGLIGLMGFILITMWAVAPLICYPHPTRPDGYTPESVLAYPEVLCWETSEHTILILLGLTGLLMGPILLFVICIRATYIYASRVAKGDSMFIKSYGFMFSRFQPWRYSFGLVQLLHNLLLSLTPVLIRSDLAGQIMFMGVVLLSFAVCHAYFQPFRIKGGDEVYVFAFSFLIILILLNTIAITDVIQGDSILALGILLAILSSTVLVCFISWATFAMIYTNPWYAFFVCHAKRQAGSLARLLQIKFQQRTARPYPTFIDADHLVHLDRLFNTVRKSLGHLVVILDNHTTTRPWCAGEITTAHRNNVPLIPLQTVDHEPPEDDSGKNLFQADRLGFNFADSGLAAYSILVEDIVEAYNSLIKITPVMLPKEFKEQAIDSTLDRVISRATNCVLTKDARRSGNKLIMASSQFEGDVVVISDFSCMEANCNVILMRQKLFTFVKGIFLGYGMEKAETDPEKFVYKVCNEIQDFRTFSKSSSKGSKEQVRVESEKDVTGAFTSAVTSAVTGAPTYAGAHTTATEKKTKRKAVLIMYSQNFLKAADSLMLAAMAMAESKRDDTKISVLIVPVVLPFFNFPGNVFFNDELEGVVTRCLPATQDRVDLEVPQVRKLLRNLFKIICVVFDTQASDTTITSGAAQVLSRIMNLQSTKTNRAHRGSEHSFTRDVNLELENSVEANQKNEEEMGEQKQDEEEEVAESEHGEAAVATELEHVKHVLVLGETEPQDVPAHVQQIEWL